MLDNSSLNLSTAPAFCNGQTLLVPVNALTVSSLLLLDAMINAQL